LSGLLWRWLNPVPALPADSKPWERLAAHGGHAGLYVLMFVVVRDGMGGRRNLPHADDRRPARISIPPLVGGLQREVRDLFEETHKILAYILAVLVLLHVAARSVTI
jgi:cytochrome b561